MEQRLSEIAERLGVDPDDPAVMADLERIANGPQPESVPRVKPPQRGAADPGWYPCQGRLRWWDGTAWTSQWGSSKPKWSKSAQLGMWLALFLPPVGFLVGLALVAGRDPHAHWVVSTSIIVPVIVIVLMTS